METITLIAEIRTDVAHDSQPPPTTQMLLVWRDSPESPWYVCQEDLPADLTTKEPA